MKWIFVFSILLPLSWLGRILNPEGCRYVLPTASYGSLGDDAMVRLLLAHLNDKGTPAGLLVGDDPEGWGKAFSGHFTDLISLRTGTLFAKLSDFFGLCSWSAGSI
jgi:hypothetical protein